MNINTELVLVTVTYNAERFIKMFIESIREQDVRGTLLIVDNASVDNTVSLCKKLSCGLTNLQVIVLEQNINLGVAEGNNVGIRWALENGTKYVMLINNDVEFAAQSLPILLHYSMQHDAITVPLIYYGDQQDKVWYGGGGFANWKGLNQHWEELPKAAITRVEYAPTCCMVIPSKVFNTVGLMDPNYFVYFDDTDFCARLLEYKIPIYLLRDSMLNHYVSSSTGGEDSPLQVYFGNRNRLYYINKRVKGLYKVSAYAYIIATRTVKVGMYLIQGKSRQFKALTKGITDYFRGEMGAGSFIKK